MQQRCAVFSIGYSLAMALFAGTAPLVATWLVDQRHWPWATPLYCLPYALLALWAVQSTGRLEALSPATAEVNP